MRTPSWNLGACWSAWMSATLLASCSAAVPLAEGGACVRNSQCAVGLVCGMGRCTSDLTGFNMGMVPPRPDSGPADGAVLDGALDGGAAADSGPPVDAGPGMDAGPTPVDSGPVEVDSGPVEVDSGPVEVDSGPVEVDSGSAGDAGADIDSGGL